MPLYIARVRNPGDMDWTSLQPVRNLAASETHLSSASYPPPPSFTKPIPGAKKVGDHTGIQTTLNIPPKTTTDK